ncbi:hypothetical protein ACLQ28_05930 [Micromonospora sp. DT201]|uniref:hypothetical protein n=1 Tax=Micromonospora sp. DT201 TaxID=3393442 RepID=UPI003CF7C668
MVNTECDWAIAAVWRMAQKATCPPDGKRVASAGPGSGTPSDEAVRRSIDTSARMPG